MINKIIHFFSVSKKHTIGLSMARVFYGTALAVQILVNWSDRKYLWLFSGSDESLMQKLGFRSSIFTSLFHFHYTLAILDTVLIITFILSILFSLGIFTKIINILLLIFFYEVYSLNSILDDGGHNLLVIVLSYFIFIDTSQYFSIDSLIRKKYPHMFIHYGRYFDFLKPYLAMLHNIFFYLTCLQVVVLYTVSGLAKLRGTAWLNGTAITDILQIPEFSVWPEINYLVNNSYFLYLSVPISYISALFQVFFGPFMLNKYTKILTILFMFGMHICIGIFMGLPLFSLIMIATELIFIKNTTFTKTYHYLETKLHAHKTQTT